MACNDRGSMVNFASRVQRYQWPLIVLALILVQSAPLAIKVLGIIGLGVVAVASPVALLGAVAATTPLYLMPVAITGSAAIPLHEIVWVIAILAWGVTRWRHQH